MVRTYTVWRTHWRHKEDDIRKKKDGADKCKIYKQDYMWRIFDYSLGGYYFQKYWMQLLNWSGGHVFDTRISLKYLELKYDGLHYILSLYLKKSFSTIASGATPIGSAERAPDDISW
jgi:hypothetical protein